MQSESSKDLTSTDNPALLEQVESRIKQGEPVVILLRFNSCGGSHAYFIVKSIGEFRQVLQKARRKDALSVFFSQSFPVHGKISDELKRMAIKFLEEVIQDDDEAIFVIRLDTNEIFLGLDDIKTFTEPKQIDEWFDNNLGAPVFVGTLPFWEDDSNKMITAYVRDSDGQLRRGAY